MSYLIISVLFGAVEMTVILIFCFNFRVYSGEMLLYRIMDNPDEYMTEL